MAGKVRWNRREESLALALASGSTARKAAEVTGFSERHVYRKLADSLFRSQVQQLRDEIVGQTCATLSAKGIEAVAALSDLMQQSASDAVRLSAARAVIELGLRLREANDLLTRIRNLEESAGEAQRSD